MIVVGDVVIGVGFSGLYFNGFSLVCWIVFEMVGLEFDDCVEVCDVMVVELLLELIKIYVMLVWSVFCYYKVK